jgi:hypothetical protein
MSTMAASKVATFRRFATVVLQIGCMRIPVIAVSVRRLKHEGGISPGKLIETGLRVSNTCSTDHNRSAFALEVG